MTNLAGSEPAESRLWRAEHAGAAYNQDIEDGRVAVSDRVGLGYLAHLTYGIVDFALGVPDRWPTHVGSVQAIESAVRQLGLAIVQLDESCEPLDSGVLIRVVVQGEHGALFHVLKVAGQSFSGITFHGSEQSVERADTQMTALARASASRIGGPSLDWGGFRDREHSGELLQPYQDGPSLVHDRTAAITVGRGVDLPGQVTDACRHALHPHSLHYVAIYRRDELVWSADIFDTRELAPHFQRVSPSVRRRGYMRLMHQVDLQFRRFSQLLAVVGSEHLVRLVLDVARGAIYVLPLADDDFLVAVTLTQSQVHSADQGIRALQADIGASWPTAGLPWSSAR